jgi:phosphatidylglycerophosphate synthase
MGFIKRFKEKNGDLFVYLKAEEVHPHDYFLAKTVLRFFPEWITPNRITVFRIIATPVVFFLALYNYHVWSIIAFILVASTDALDGSLARTEDKITRFGMLFDPLADKFLVGSLILVLVFSISESLAWYRCSGYRDYFYCFSARGTCPIPDGTYGKSVGGK